jgi:leucyl aminopeptidase
VVKNASAAKAESLTCVLPTAATLGIDDERLGYETELTIAMADYYFDDYITTKKSKKLNALTLYCHTHDVSALETGVMRGALVATAVNKARHWIDLPPAVIHPVSLAEKAIEIGKKHTNIKVTTFGDKEAAELGMGGLLGVSRGSEHECRLVVMEYKAPKKDALTLALVGKGITFDSGGLSIKPANSMETMKDDMSGAAAVIATMEALATIKPDMHVIGVAALAENMPSGNATRPGDILKFYNGKTAEVKNTDAEGRLVLADALSYTVDIYKPDAIIDIATLTGACAYALGPLFTGMMSQDDDLAMRVQKAGTLSGDRVWRLPMSNDYKKAVKSTVADICNIGSKSYNAGAITAAFFLKEFVGNTPWVHLDIAGTAFDVPDIAYYRPGATGVGVRLFIDLITNWQ